MSISSSGIVRKIDDLGRIVVPKEIRRMMHVSEGDPIEIFTDDSGRVILKRYSPIGQFSEFTQKYAECIAKSIEHVVVITDKHEIVAVLGETEKEGLKKDKLSPDFENLISGHELKLDNLSKICEKQPDNLITKAMMPISSLEYGTIGSVVFLSTDNNIIMGDFELKLIQTCAEFLRLQYDV